MHIQNRADLGAVRIGAHNLSSIPHLFQQEPAQQVIELVAGVSGVTAGELLQSRRGRLLVARNRQLAMYLLHIVFSYNMKQVGDFFGRDRTTVAHACARVEDRRDEPAFETMICDLEAQLEALRRQQALTLQVAECGEGA